MKIIEILQFFIPPPLIFPLISHLTNTSERFGGGGLKHPKPPLRTHLENCLRTLKLLGLINLFMTQ